MKLLTFIKISFGFAWCLVMLFSCNGHMNMDMGGTVSARNVTEQTFSNPLAVPAVLDGTNATLAAKSGTAILGSRITVNALGYGGAAILGPTIRLQQGAQFNLTFSNNLSEATNLHWHGLEVPAKQDGYPSDLTQPGGTFVYQFTIKNRPGTYWYHPHPDMATARQAYRGLAGFFLVSSPEEEALGLPSGAFDVPLVVQDKRLDGGLVYDPNTNDRSIGMFGETVLVNGTAGAMLEVATRTYRLRLLNGSNARIYNFALSTGAKFQLIGTDGGLIGAAKEISTVLLAPAERADVLVNFGNLTVGTELYLQSNAFDGTESQGKQFFKILKFKVVHQVTDDSNMPTALMPVEKIPESQSVTTRSFDIGHMMQHGNGMNNMIMHTINGKTFDANRRDELVKAGTVEIWEFDNTKGTETHPMHLHAGSFQVLSRTGGRGLIEPWEYGWKDTVLAFPGEKVRIIVRFPDLKGKFVFHCHNLEHEDGGMMLNYEIQ
ncbi:MAG: multicopper oxidase family protein [Haliscomenobacter sp.]|nr:multicopper oxidase family protein [Haliscomenobacter sp.]